MTDTRLRELERRKTVGDDTDRAAWLHERIRRGEQTKLACCETGTITLAELVANGYTVDCLPIEAEGARQSRGTLRDAMAQMEADVAVLDSGAETALWRDVWRSSITEDPNTRCPRCLGSKLLPLWRAVEVASMLGDPAARAVAESPLRNRAPFYAWAEQLQLAGREVQVRASVAMAWCALAKRWPDLQAEVVMQPLSEWLHNRVAIEKAEDWLNHPCAETEEAAFVAHIGARDWASLPYAAINQVAHWQRMTTAVSRRFTGKALKAAVAKALIPVLLA